MKNLTSLFDSSAPTSFDFDTSISRGGNVVALDAKVDLRRSTHAEKQAKAPDMTREARQGKAPKRIVIELTANEHFSIKMAAVTTGKSIRQIGVEYLTSDEMAPIALLSAPESYKKTNRLSIEVTEAQHQAVQMSALLEGKKIKPFVLQRLFG